VIDTTAHDGQAEADVDRVAKAQELGRDGRLVVIHGHHSVDLAPCRLAIRCLSTQGPDELDRALGAAQPTARERHAGLDDLSFLQTQ